jgi:hypothetical protein
MISNSLRQQIAERGARANNPPTPKRRKHLRFSPKLYRKRQFDRALLFNAQALLRLNNGIRRRQLSRRRQTHLCPYLAQNYEFATYTDVANSLGFRYYPDLSQRSLLHGNVLVRTGRMFSASVRVAKLYVFGVAPERPRAVISFIP